MTSAVSFGRGRGSMPAPTIGSSSGRMDSASYIRGHRRPAGLLYISLLESEGGFEAIPSCCSSAPCFGRGVGTMVGVDFEVDPLFEEDLEVGTQRQH